eukprot:736229-Pyramimonas_sp.AAC.1
MIRSGNCSRTILAWLGGTTSTAPAPIMAPHSFLSEISNLALSAGVSRLSHRPHPRAPWRKRLRLDRP